MDGQGDTDEIDEGARSKTIRRVFLAGKITGNDWRRQLMRADPIMEPEDRWTPCMLNWVAQAGSVRFPVREAAILGLFDYVGPYYVGCAHFRPCSHGCADRYRCGTEQRCGCDLDHGNHGSWPDDLREALVRANQEAITRADLVFAWLDDVTAYATMYEIGYAAALDKEIWIAGPRVFSDMALVYAAARCNPFGLYGEPVTVDTTPLAAFTRILGERMSDPREPVRIDPAALSPIEARFLAAWHESDRDHPFIGLVPQYPVDGGRYRLDFAWVSDSSLYFNRLQRPLRIGIELDGLEAHRTTDQIAYDRKRQRELESMGWKIIRFGGKEVHDDAERCVAEARCVIEGAIEEAR